MDWKVVITDLEGAGLTQSAIAEKAGCSQPYVSQLKSGARKSPDFEVGKALVDNGLPKKRGRREARAA
jgi:transcriptional regulator with XRE-family HTH domain